jgi:hypothetical protein
MHDASLKPWPRASSEHLRGGARDALRRSIDRHHRFAFLLAAFIWLGLGAIFFVSDLVRAPAATLWALFYFGAVCWAVRHEQELQRQVGDAKRDAARDRLGIAV